ncbi:MAG: flagellar biosynthesis/type III secretory pathway protein [Lachnospiraceae bacterium]|nr:flagellar biosynthesis/type III secretory pathway protein [Lachnospiraceae bacterium]
MQKELQEKRAALEAEFSARFRDLELEYTSKRDNMEADLVDVILDVFNKVFHIQFDNKKHILMHLINDAILNIEGDRNFRIKVADSNVLFLENHREDILERVGHGIELEFIADSTMDGNDCLIETDSGVFDCSLGTQLENLIKDIRSLSS